MIVPAPIHVPSDVVTTEPVLGSPVIAGATVFNGGFTGEGTKTVVDTEPVTKGQTASSSYKPAILSNGVRTAVPPHIGTGTRVVVTTENGEYVERAKD